jgi:hypothetical protein
MIDKPVHEGLLHEIREGVPLIEFDYNVILVNAA